LLAQLRNVFGSAKLNLNDGYKFLCMVNQRNALEGKIKTQKGMEASCVNKWRYCFCKWEKGPDGEHKAWIKLCMPEDDYKVLSGNGLKEFNDLAKNSPRIWHNDEGVTKPLVVVDTIRISTIETMKQYFCGFPGWWVEIIGNAKKPCNGPRKEGCPEPQSYCSKCKGTGSDGNKESECTIHLRTQKHRASKTRANEFENTLRKALKYTRANEFENTFDSHWLWTEAKFPCVGLPPGWTTGVSRNDRPGTTYYIPPNSGKSTYEKPNCPSALDGQTFLYQKKNARHIRFWKECFQKDPQVDEIDADTLQLALDQGIAVLPEELS